MQKTIILAFAALALGLMLSGCARQQATELATGADAGLGTEISGLDQVDSELDTSELDSLDQELADIDSIYS